jgi:hypothetical protein
VRAELVVIEQRFQIRRDLGAEPQQKAGYFP